MSDRVELWSTSAQRSEFEDLAELFAILKTTEYLESAYARDVVDSAEYQESCIKLITQCKNTERALVQRGTIESLQQFVKRYNVDCPRAVERMNIGAPDALTTANNGSDDRMKQLVLIKDMTDLFNYIANLLGLGQTSKEELAPQVDALLRLLRQATSFLHGFDATSLEQWARTLQQMRVVDSLDEEQTKQFSYDLNAAKAQIDDILKYA